MARASSSKITQEISDSESSYSSSSEDVSEDEFGEELTPALDAAILQTLGKIKRREGVYSGENVLQEALKEAEAKAGSMGVKALQRAVAEKPFLLADHHRAALLEKRAQDVDDEEYVDDNMPLTNVQEQRMLREGAVNAFKSLAAESEDEDDGDGFLLKARDNEEADEGKDDEQYRRFLLAAGGGEEEVRKILGMGQQPGWAGADEEEEVIATDGVPTKEKKKKKKSKKDNGEQEEVLKERKERKDKNDDDFLMNYILNRGWIDRSEKHVPTYEEVVGPVEEDDEQDAGEPSHPWGTLEDEDEFDEKAEEFETAYNFRYEEPGSSSIAAHPRDIPSLVRRADDTRKTKRQARAERKAAEKAAAEEETRRLKGKKRREMEAQIEALKKELGDDMDWTALEKVLDGEWDEAEWERVVGTMLSEAAAREDDEKPAWDDMGDAEYDDMDGPGWGEYGPGEEGEVEYEDVPFEDDDDEGPVNMDADFVDEEPRQKKSKKDKKDKKSRERPVEVDPSLSVAERAEKVKQTLEEYTALDHEDIVGDVKTRFKYTRSAPVDLGLTPVEILLATDAELNALAGVRHLAPYRRGGFGRAGMGLGKRIRELKADLRARRWGDEEGAEASRKEKARVKGSGANADGMGKKRKWGEDGEAGAAGSGDKAPKAETANGAGPVSGQGGEGPKKRLGKKQRMKAKLAAEAAAMQEGDVAIPQNVAIVDTVGARAQPEANKAEGADTADGGSKKKRKKNKKKSGGEAA